MYESQRYFSSIERVPPKPKQRSVYSVGVTDADVYPSGYVRPALWKTGVQVLDDLRQIRDAPGLSSAVCCSKAQEAWCS